MRVIAGTAKGHTLRVPKVPGLRPTSDRARESLFNVLAPGIEGSRVLDVFAGSGALGIEALSRGAIEATFVERSRRAAEVLADNVEKCGFRSITTIIAAEWRVALRRLGGDETRFDLALFDPPYAWDRADHCLAGLAEHSLLAEGGLAIIEHRASTELEIPDGWSLDRVLKVGDSAFSFCTGCSAS